jgi:hypothetical protein
MAGLKIGQEDRAVLVGIVGLVVAHIVDIRKDWD